MDCHVDESRGRIVRIALPALVFALLGGCAAAPAGLTIPTTARNGTVEQIPAILHKPDGAGPFPAVVIMHDCSGLGPTSSGAPERWAKELLAQGFVVIIPDSFSSRGHELGVCTDPSPSRNEVSPYRRARDAYAALSYLRGLPYVDGEHIGLLGRSHGASTTLVAMVASGGNWQPLGQEPAGFAAAVALFPECNLPLGGWRNGAGVFKPRAPLLILIGEKDDWTPAEPCVNLAAAAQAAGYPVSLTVLPNAYHAFDSPEPVRHVAKVINRNAPGGRGATIGGDPRAWRESIRQVDEFFAHYLQPRGTPSARH
jgi:dienelactone hydrolase